VLALWGKVYCYMVVGFQSQVYEMIVGLKGAVVIIHLLGGMRKGRSVETLAFL
jgi:hypothetical protein